MSITVTISHTGVVFNRRQRDQVLVDMAGAMIDTLGQQGMAEVGFWLDRFIRRPTPYYETQIISQRTSENITTVHDRGIIYGPWLAGISRRNRTTSFKGYPTWVLATAALETKAPRILETVAAEFIGKLDS